MAAAACAASPLHAFNSQRPIGGDATHEPSSQPSSGADDSADDSNDWKNHAAALQGMSRASFAGVVGTHFKVLSAPDAPPVWLTLLAVEDLPKLAEPNVASFAVALKRSGAAPASTGFVLCFGSSAQLAQGSYLFQHDGLGSFALFMVPEGGGQQVYNATVNRLDGAAIVAFPVRPVGTGAALSTATGASAGPATSSGTDSLPAGLAETPGARRSVTRD